MHLIIYISNIQIFIVGIVPSWITDIKQSDCLSLRSSMIEVRDTTNDGEREPKLYISGIQNFRVSIKFRTIDECSSLYMVDNFLNFKRFNFG